MDKNGENYSYATECSSMVVFDSPAQNHGTINASSTKITNNPTSPNPGIVQEVTHILTQDIC